MLFVSCAYNNPHTDTTTRESEEPEKRSNKTERRDKKNGKTVTRSETNDIDSYCKRTKWIVKCFERNVF